MSTVNISTVDESSYALSVGEHMDYPNINPIGVLHACPGGTEVLTIDCKHSTGTSFVFEHTFTGEQFLSNAFKFRMTFPLVFYFKSAIAGVTADNFIEKVFNHGSDMCVAQYGMVQGVETLQVALNGKSIDVPLNIDVCLNMISQYYNAEKLAEWFPASQQDCYQEFTTYDATTKQLKYYDGDGEVTYTSLAPDQMTNPFSSREVHGYMSRTPRWRFVSADANSIRLLATHEMYLPLSFTSTPDAITTLVGVNHLRAIINMKPDFVSHIYNTKDTFWTRISSFAFNRADTGSVLGRMFTQIFRSPNGLPLPRNEVGLLHPYSISLPNINIDMSHTVRVAPGQSASFNTIPITTNTVPTALYIAAVRVKNGTQEEMTQTPISYGLIKRLEISSGGTRSSFGSINALSYLADCNGYDAFSDDISRLTKGFCIKLDMTKDVTLPGINAVGASSNIQFAISGDFINTSATTNDYQLVVLTSLPVSLEYNGAGFDVSSGVLIDAQKLLDSDFLRSMKYNYGRRMDLLGAGLWNDIKKGVAGLARNAWANRQQIASTVGDIAGLIKTLRGGERHYSTTSGAGTQFLGGSDVSTTKFFPQGAGKPKKSVFK